MGFAANAAALAARTTIRTRGVEVVYTRTDEAEETLTMVHTNPLHTISDPEGASITVQSDDWLVLPADFREAFGDSAVPEDDDRITYDGRVYRVRPMANEPGWRKQKDGALWRVHSKDEGTV